VTKLTVDFDFLGHFLPLVLLYQKRLGHDFSSEQIGASTRAISSELEAFCETSLSKKLAP
jgi:hypothetical protein